ncbi:MAG: hypothetical protein JWN95_2425 [Frankiales bacterium]|nr:hypothetical protein [Frankiales bacterium]
MPAETRAVSAASAVAPVASGVDTGRRGPFDFGRRLWDSSYRPALIATGVAALLAWGFLLLPPMNTDMAAQLARADFARHYPVSIIDFRWYGGTVVYGYTLWAAAAMAAVGTKVAGAIAAVIGTWYTTRLLQRLKPVRAVFGGIAAAITQVANVTEGRVTFALGLACGLIAVTLFTTTRMPRWAGIALAALFSLLCGGASPVAALLLWVAGGVALLMRRPGAAATLILPSALTVGITSVIFGDGGQQPFSFLDCLKSVVALVIVLITVPRRCRAIRLGAALGIVMVLAAFLLATPVGSNANRLSMLFALPVVATFIQWRSRWLTALALIGVLAVQLPLNTGDVASLGKASGYSGYYNPVIQAIRAQPLLTGRVEVPDLEGHWDAVYLARGVPLARGWLRQTDVRLNDDVFYRQLPNINSYRTFLNANAVEYVAVPDAKLTKFGKPEYELIKSGLPYLSPIWRNQHWTLYKVIGFNSLVDHPSTVRSMTPNAIVLAVPKQTSVLVRLRWHPWLGMESTDKGSCIGQDGLYVRLHTRLGGSYTLNSKVPIGTGHCPKT